MLFITYKQRVFEFQILHVVGETVEYKWYLYLRVSMVIIYSKICETFLDFSVLS